MIDEVFVKGEEDLPEISFSLTGMPEGWMGVTLEQYEEGLEDTEFPVESRVLFKDYSEYDSELVEDAIISVDWEEIESRFGVTLDENGNGLDLPDLFTYTENEMDEIFLACIELLDKALRENEQE